MGDVIGTLLDLNACEISYWRNNKFMGVAFKNVPVGPNLAYFPAVSMSRGERVIFNFGLRPFLNQSFPFQPCALNEPNCKISNYEVSAQFICQKLRNYVTQFTDPKHSAVSDDEKFLVGTVLLDYLQPMLEDPFIFEAHFFQLLFDFSKQNKTQALFKAIDLIFYELKAIIPRLFTVLVRKLHNQRVDYA